MKIGRQIPGAYLLVKLYELYIEILESDHHLSPSPCASLGLLEFSGFPPIFSRLLQDTYLPRYLFTYLYSTGPLASLHYCCSSACVLFPFLPCLVSFDPCMRVYVITCTYHIIPGRIHSASLRDLGR